MKTRAATFNGNPDNLMAASVTDHLWAAEELYNAAAVL